MAAEEAQDLHPFQILLHSGRGVARTKYMR